MVDIEPGLAYAVSMLTLPRRRILGSHTFGLVLLVVIIILVPLTVNFLVRQSQSVQQEAAGDVYRLVVQSRIVKPGNILTVVWINPRDTLQGIGWIKLFKIDGNSHLMIQAINASSCVRPGQSATANKIGTCTFTAPSQAGTYEFRWYVINPNTGQQILAATSDPIEDR